MKKRKSIASKICILLLLTILVGTHSLGRVFAATFTTALIRPGTHSINSSPLPILVSVKTGTTALEDSFRLSVPTEYQYSGTAAHYTVSTSLLPSGYQAWPGIGTATNVDGNQITFSSGDLQPGVTYGFYLTGGITTTPTAVSGAESVWQVETFSLGSEVDSSFVTVPVESSSEVTISAAVPHLSSDYSVSLVSDTTASVSQDSEIGFTLTYSTAYSYNTPITLQANWSQGTIAGSSTASVDIAEYVAGSASTAFGGAVPVIDPQARTITWTISSISAADGEQSVTFSLGTTQNYKGSETVEFTVTGGIIEPAVSLPTSVTQTYLYDAPEVSVTPTPSPTPTPSTTSTVSPTPLPSASPSSSVVPTTVVSVTVPTIADSMFEVIAGLSAPGTVELLYGTSQTSLTRRIISPALTDIHSIVLENLDSGSRYYFSLRVTSVSGVVSTSDIYTVLTASQPLMGYESAVSTLYFDGLPLTPRKNGGELSIVALPANQTYQLIVHFPSDPILKAFRLSVSYDQFFEVGSAYQIPFVNVGNNNYVATIKADAPMGRYSVMYDIEDYFGNRLSKQAGYVRVVQPLTIMDSQTQDPIEHARVEVKRYNEQLRLYEALELETSEQSNEWWSDYAGVVALALPEGRYQMTVSAPGYTTKIHEFEISEQTDSYPLIELDREGGFFIGRLSYFINSLSSVGQNLSPLVDRILGSKTIFTIIAVLTMILLSAGLVVSLAAKMHIAAHKLPLYLLNRLRSLGKTAERDLTLQGKVINAGSRSPVSRADVAVLDDKKIVVATTQTASNGYFHVAIPNSPSSILITEPGYLPNTFHLPASPAKATLLFKINTKSSLSNAETRLGTILKFVTSSAFEVILVVFCLAQFYFVASFGIWAVLPFILFSALNLLIWTVFLSTHILPQQFTELEAVIEK